MANGVSMRTEVAVYDFIVKYVIKHNYFPSIREICDGANYSSTCTVKRALDNLCDRGLIETDVDGRNSRAYRVKELKLVRRKNNGEQENG